MLEQLLIFTRGGLILWTCKEIGNALKGSPIDTLIRSCLLEERSGADSYNYDAPGASYTLKWAFHNELGLVFVAVYQKILHLLYVNDLLELVKREFSVVYDPKRMVYNDFDETFRQLRVEAEARAEEMKRTKPAGKPVGNVLGKKQGGQQKKLAQQDGGSEKKSDGSESDDGSKGKTYKIENGHSNGNQTKENGFANGKENGNSSTGAFDVNKLHKLKAKSGKKADALSGKAGKKSETLAGNGLKPEAKKKMTKKNRVWNDAHPPAKLDFTDSATEVGDEHIEPITIDQGETMMDKEEVLSSDSESEEEEEVEKDNKTATKKKRWFSSMFQR